MDEEYRQIVENPRKANRYEKVHTLTVRQIQCKTKESYRSAHRIGKNVQLVPSIRKEQLKLQVWRGWQLLQAHSGGQQSGSGKSSRRRKWSCPETPLWADSQGRHVWRCSPPRWKQPKYPSTREGISNPYCSRTMEYDGMCHQRLRSHDHGAKAEAWCRLQFSLYMLMAWVI